MEVNKSRLIEICEESVDLIDEARKKYGVNGLDIPDGIDVNNPIYARLIARHDGFSKQLQHILGGFSSLDSYIDLMKNGVEFNSVESEMVYDLACAAKYYIGLLDSNEDFRKNEMEKEYSCYLRQVDTECSGCHSDICTGINYTDRLRYFFERKE